eukprot:TRINITY_DN21734_c0_g1_i1.p1 TRINITY_DN21734_c0_g1~~TRINITY_DN21734_c0_g1_i1.p1  ORF type:complete len:365 (-),score=31.97 TRINITY_DN21734_c0_g1_i1:125-1219(-)
MTNVTGDRGHRFSSGKAEVSLWIDHSLSLRQHNAPGDSNDDDDNVNDGDEDNDPHSRETNNSFESQDDVFSDAVEHGDNMEGDFAAGPMTLATRPGASLYGTGAVTHETMFFDIGRGDSRDEAAQTDPLCDSSTSPLSFATFAAQTVDTIPPSANLVLARNGDEFFVAQKESIVVSLMPAFSRLKAALEVCFCNASHDHATIVELPRPLMDDATWCVEEFESFLDKRKTGIQMCIDTLSRYGAFKTNLMPLDSMDDQFLRQQAIFESFDHLSEEDANRCYHLLFHFALSLDAKIANEYDCLVMSFAEPFLVETRGGDKQSVSDVASSSTTASSSRRRARSKKGRHIPIEPFHCDDGKFRIRLLD